LGLAGFPLGVAPLETVGGLGRWHGLNPLEFGEGRVRPLLFIGGTLRGIARCCP
jgi:hypothetical protein